MNEVGRPTQLNDELCIKIQELVTDGKTYKEVCAILEINYDTWQGWFTRNYNGFRDKLTSYRHERMLQKAEANIEVLQDADDEKVALTANIFVAETLGKRAYSKRNELTGSNGEALTVNVVNYAPDNSTA